VASLSKQREDICLKANEIVGNFQVLKFEPYLENDAYGSIYFEKGQNKFHHWPCKICLQEHLMTAFVVKIKPKNAIRSDMYFPLSFSNLRILNANNDRCPMS
jgi:hypothetical protein